LNGFVVDIDADDGVGAQLCGLLLHLGHGDVLGLTEFAFVGGGAAADDVADAGEEVLEDVGAENGFAADDAEVLVEVVVSSMAIF
jgi:hypothetical protein